jgi:membrane fusion protein (multidrug efflux system)
MTAGSLEEQSTPHTSEHPKSRGSKFLRYAIPIAGVLALVAALGATKAAQIKMLIGFGKTMKAMGPPPEVVSTALAQQQAWEGTLSAVASVVSAKGVAVSNDAAGVVSRINFESGQIVKQGQLLLELDTKVERAQLASAKARRELADLSARRSRTLVSSGAIASAQLDTDESAAKGAGADVSALEAQIARKTITAPFGGKLGIRAVNLGQYLAPGTTITTLESTQNVYVDFTLPQRDVASLQVGMEVRATQSEGDSAPVLGAISAIDPSVDAATRSVHVRASLPNQDERLRPGMFVRVSVVLPKQGLVNQGEVVAIPLTAVIHASFGDSVFTVEDDPHGPDGKPRKIARQQFVKLGEARGDFTSVLDGLKAGQEVVTSGGFKLRNGLPIVIDNNSVKLKPALDPHPENK